LADGLTSFYAGFVIFALLGNLAAVTGLKISDMTGDSGKSFTCHLVQV
jgi:hypothetical protein